MQSHATAKEAGSHASRPFFDLQAARSPTFFSPSPLSVAAKEDTEGGDERAIELQGAEVQAKLTIGERGDHYEREADAMADRVVRRQAAGMDDGEHQAKPLQAKASTSSADFSGNSAPAVQRKCAACDAEKRVQPQLEVGAVDDPLEIEADAMADHVVRRKAADMGEREAEPLQAKSDGAASSESSAPGLETGLAGSSGSGSPLAPHIRDHMEDAFDADFSGVRVHTGSASAAMNDEIGARAFTYGSEIHFNEGEFSPGTERGTHLLAHELTHVVQQNSDVRRAPKRVQAKRMQRGPIVFGPSTGMPRGNLIHNEGLLKTFHAPGLNEGLWIEPPIPGANRDKVEVGRRGEPDFYRDNAADGRPIGINENKTGGFSRMGIAVAAPKPPNKSGGPMQAMDHAPTSIELGDVKPGQSGEEHVGRDQITRYSKGIRNTAKAVNDYQAANNHPERWDPKPGPMKKLDVPPTLAKPNTSGVRFGALSMWEWVGRWKLWSATQMKGSCIVYKSSVSGIWAYEWMPVDVPANLGDDRQLKDLVERLDKKVKPRLHSGKKTAGKMQASPAARRRAQRQALGGVLRRAPKKHEKFDEKGWLDAYNPWKTDAEKQLGDSTTKKNVGVLEGLTEAKHRTGFDPGIPQVVKDRAKGAATVQHWVRYGKLYGWLRKTFDRVYVKLAGFAQSVKAKVKTLSKSAGSSGFGNWIKAAALALWKVAKRLGAWAVSMIVDKLLDSLQEGVSNVLNQLAEAVTPEEVKSKIEEVEELKAKYEEMLQAAQDKLEKWLFGDKLELFSKLDEYMKIATAVSTIVSVVRWGIRIVACASPPLLGCLWNLAIAALEYAFSKIMETCWFQAKVLGWVRDSGIQEIIDFPTKVAATIAEKGNSLLKLPEGIGPLFAEIKIDHREFKIDCEGGGDSEEGGGRGPEPTEEQKALMQVAKEVGDKKFAAFLEMAAKRAADYNVALDAERIKKLGALIKSLSIEQMKMLAENQPTAGVPVPVEEFLKSIATLTPVESTRKAARNIDYAKAQHSNANFERVEIGWKPSLFVRSRIASDSREFADAIYDIQKLLGIKGDGMAGPRTTKAFYERNRQTKDGAYETASQLVAKEEQAKAEKKAAAEKLKQVEALLKDEKIKAAVDAALPSEDQLKKDLASVQWDDVDEAGFKFTLVSGRTIYVVKTDAGHRMGAYFNYVEREFQGAKSHMVVKTGRFFALDKISAGESIGFSTATKEEPLGIGFIYFSAQESGTFLDRGKFVYFGQHVNFE